MARLISAIGHAIRLAVARPLLRLALAGLLSLTAAAPAWAADTASVGQIAQVLGQRNGVRAEFTQTQTLAALDKPAVSRGKLVFARQQGVLWQVLEPYQTTYIFRDEQVIEIDASGKRAVRDSRTLAGMRQVTQLMRAMLSGDLSGLYSQFRVTASGSTAQWRLQLQPDQPQLAQAIKGITLSGGSFLQSLHIDLAGGDATQLDFTQSEVLDALTPAEQAEFGGH